ncbi:ankyrin repeat domain-containing protein 6 [Pygocentrus nattereri]|uniref:ankyrin repeat domain-containing protein 6 n=1 Tax=Pygocentrus nattereri TaxID=42514 RepID=UPI001891485C|nr:ankyrin repeat domain-containing protein 6 [Pygocentrus nattereri]
MIPEPREEWITLDLSTSYWNWADSTRQANRISNKASCCPTLLSSCQSLTEVTTALQHTSSGFQERLENGHQTALHRAAVVGNREVISALVQGGCALDLQDKEGNTALHEVAWHGFSQCVKALVKAGASVHVKNKAGNTALHLACQNGHAHSARVLLLGGSVPDSKNNAGDTCLHIAARYNHVAMIKILLGAFCSVAEKNQVGDTALHLAAALNHRKTVSLLLEAGADSCVKNNAGCTALDKARDSNNREVALLLAKSNQVQRFARGRTVRKRRDLQRAQRRAQSVPRDEVLDLAGKDRASVAEDTHSSDRALCRTGQPLHKTTTSSPHTRRKTRRLKERSEHASLRENLLKTPRRCSPSLQEDGRCPNGRAYQLYTLYRDEDGHIKQTPASGCNCKPLIKKLENQLKTTKKEMRSQIHTVQEQMNCRLGRIDRQSKHQIKVLEKMTQERVSAERMECHYRINQRATEERMEDQQRQQASAASKVKSWCMSKLQDMEVHLPAEAQYYKLLHSPSTDRSTGETDQECLPLLSVISEDSISSLATYVNVLPKPAAAGSAGKSPEFDDLQGRKYFEVKLDSSPSGPGDNYENLSERQVMLPSPCMPVNTHRPLSRQLANADPQWLSKEQQETECRLGQNEEFSYSSTSSSLSTPSRGVDDSDPDPVRLQAWHHRRHLKDRIKAHRASVQQGGTMHTLEFFSEPPTESPFIRERANLHAIEVTQRFFETVSTQLERWYERKIQEAQRAVEHRAQQDRAGLLERINTLEEELRRLRASTPTDS